MPQPILDLQPLISPALGMFTAVGILTVAANALSNFAGARLYDRTQDAQGDFVFCYDSDNAQRLREKLSEFPYLMMSLYFVFVPLVIILGWLALSDRSQNVPVSNDITMSFLFLLLTTPVYISIVVYKTCRISKMLYRVFNDTQGT